MHVYSNTCRICGSEIPEDRRNSGLMVCTCGWVEPTQFVERWDKESSKKISTFGIAVAVLVLPVVLYLASWSGFGGEVIGLNLKSLFGSASTADYLRKGEICEMVRKTDCAAENYGRVIHAEPQKVDAYLKLAHMYMKVQDKNSAIQVYQAFFKSGGKDANLKFRMANLMVDVGQTDLAAQTYQELLDAEPEILQITVAKSYVQLLIKLGKFENAKNIISSFQNKGDNAKDYLNEEMIQIQAQLKGGKKI